MGAPTSFERTQPMTNSRASASSSLFTNSEAMDEKMPCSMIFIKRNAKTDMKMQAMIPICGTLQRRLKYLMNTSYAIRRHIRALNRR